MYYKIVLYGQAAAITAVAANSSGSLVNVEVVATGVVTFVGAYALLAAKKMLDRLNRMIDEFPNVLAALYGPVDDKGVRIADGLVRQTNHIVNDVASMKQVVDRIPEIESKIDDAIQVAEESRKAAAKVAEDMFHIHSRKEDNK